MDFYIIFVFLFFLKTGRKRMMTMFWSGEKARKKSLETKSQKVPKIQNNHFKYIVTRTKNTISRSKSRKFIYITENSFKMIRNFRKKKDVATRSSRSTPKSLNLYQNLIWDRRRYTVCLPLKLQSDFRLDYFFSFLS